MINFKKVSLLIAVLFLSACNSESQGNSSMTDKSTANIEPFVCAFEKDHLPEVDPELEKQYQEVRAYEKKQIPNKDEVNITNRYQLLADQGHWKAASQLATRYLYGKGTEQSYFKAVEWFQWMADRDIPLGYYNLAVMAEKGLALKEDKEGAWKYYHRAAQFGNPQAQYRLGEIYIYIKREDDIGVAYHRCAEQQEYRNSADALGSFYQIAEENYPKALYYYQAAAALGRINSMLTLEGVFRDGDFGYEINETLADKYDKLYDRLDKNPDLKFPNLSEMLPLPHHPTLGRYNPETDQNEMTE
ncbi:sel1 repeat family protein [Amphritea atlantica]|uniref:Sel1 repeat family protein n=1 Tax=Amphritea atlantica TaxID=355243 RepID=A0ABY5GSY6_9GAMM|nr:sel1 repeat family protein [Amphritea atlantica]